MSIKTLLVDDHKTFLEQTIRLLDKECNIEVVGSAVNGKEAMELALELKPDIVVMDISMPEMNGIDVTKELRKRMPAIKVLCLTVHAERHFVTAMLKAGAIGYVLKDCPSEELTRAISIVHSGKKYVCRQVAHYVKNAN
jgi:DNA-binding NarL/FixJ family response regulator